MRTSRPAWRVVVAWAVVLFASLPSLQGYCSMPAGTSAEAVAHGCCTGGIGAIPPSCCHPSADEGKAALAGKLVVLAGAPTAILESTPLVTRPTALATVLTAPLLHGSPPPLRI